MLIYRCDGCAAEQAPSRLSHALPCGWTVRFMDAQGVRTAQHYCDACQSETHVVRPEVLAGAKPEPRREKPRRSAARAPRKQTGSEPPGGLF
jgi:hypothetical protein